MRSQLIKQLVCNNCVTCKASVREGEGETCKGGSIGSMTASSPRFPSSNPAQGNLVRANYLSVSCIVAYVVYYYLIQLCQIK